MSNSYPDVSFTLLRSNTTPLTKSYSLKNGVLEKQSPGVLSNGTAERIEINLSEIIEFFSLLNDHQAISHGSFGKKSAQITTKSRADGVISIARSTDYFSYEEGKPALILLDHDQDPKSQAVNSPQELLTKIEKIIPEIKNAAWVSKPSASAGIVDSDGNELTKDSGVHIYIVAKDGSDIPRFLSVLFQRLIVDVHGYPYITTTGTILVRTVIDKAVASPERIDYVAPAILEDGLFRNEIETHHSPGTMLDTTLLKSLSLEEETRFNAKCEEIKRSVQREADDIRSKYIERRSQEAGVSSNDIRRQLEIADNGVLADNHQILTDDGTVVRVEEILRDPGQWGGQTFHDPIEPDRGPNKAKIFFNDDGSVIMHSFIHGERNFTLREANPKGKLGETLKWAQSAPQGEVLKDWPKRVLYLSFSDQKLVIDQVLTRAPDGITKTHLNEELETLQIAKQEERIQKNIAKDGTHRINWIPSKVHKIMRDIKNTLSNEEEENTLYNYSSNLITIKQVSSKLLHSLKEEQSPQMKPLLFHMKRAILSTRLLETFTFTRSTAEGPQKIPPPTQVANNLLEDPYELKNLQGIQSWPTITQEGRLLITPGYDIKTELYVSFDYSLINQINTHPSQKDAAESLKWLQDTLYTEFPFETDNDRDAVICALLTAVMIRVLSSAPGFLFLAPIQASGKTTLIEIIFRAVFGEPAGASRWHDKEEEMGKTILAVLREGHPGIVYDNITCGAQIDSAEVAKLISGDQYQNRILGVSETAKLPAHILVTASGNQVSVIGDLMTRMLPIRLTPNDEDPSQRRFKRPNILTWVEEQRGIILGHALTILTAHLHSNGQPISITPTRFPEWDRTARTALIKAGGKDPAVLFERNKEEDNEGPAIATFINGLHSHYKGSQFTVKDLLKITLMSRENPTPEVVRTQPIMDGLTELLEGGKPESRLLATILKRIDSRVVGNLKLIKARTKGSGGVNKYRVIQIVEVEQTA